MEKSIEEKRKENISKVDKIWDEFRKNNYDYYEARRKGDCEILYAYHKDIVKILDDNYDIKTGNFRWTTYKKEIIGGSDFVAKEPMGSDFGVEEPMLTHVDIAKACYKECITELLVPKIDNRQLSPKPDMLDRDGRKLPRVEENKPVFIFTIEYDKVIVRFEKSHKNGTLDTFNFEFLLRNDTQKESSK